MIFTLPKKRDGIPSNEVSPGDERLLPPPTIVNHLPINIFLPSLIPWPRKQYGHTSVATSNPVIGISGEINQDLLPTNNMVFPTYLIIQDVFIIFTKEFHRPSIKCVGMKPVLTTKGLVKIKKDNGE